MAPLRPETAFLYHDRALREAARKHQPGLLSLRLCTTINPDCQEQNCNFGYKLLLRRGARARGGFQHAPDRAKELGRPDRLQQIIVSAEFLTWQLKGEAGDDQRLDARVGRGVANLHPGAVGQSAVGKDEIKVPALRQVRTRLLDRRCGIDVVTVAAKHVLQQHQNIRIVFDEEDASHAMPLFLWTGRAKSELRASVPAAARTG